MNPVEETIITKRLTDYVRMHGMNTVIRTGYSTGRFTVIVKTPKNFIPPLDRFTYVDVRYRGETTNNYTLVLSEKDLKNEAITEGFDFFLGAKNLYQWQKADLKQACQYLEKLAGNIEGCSCFDKPIGWSSEDWNEDQAKVTQDRVRLYIQSWIRPLIDNVREGIKE